nr:hypothetical protein [Tanacetum cinerariifolium]
MEDEHLDTVSVTESNEFIKSCVENLVPNPSESKGKNGCDLPACFTTFSNVLFDVEYEFDSVDDQSLSDEDFPEEIFSNPLFEEEINSMRIDQHHFNAEFDLIESLLNHDSSIIPSSSKIDSLLDEFTGKLTLLKSISSGIDETDCHPENEIRLIKRLLYDNSSPRPSEEFVSDNSNADIESFFPSPIPNKDSDSFMEEIDSFFNPDDPMPPSIEEDDDDSRDIPILEELLDNYPFYSLNEYDINETNPSKNKQNRTKTGSFYKFPPRWGNDPGRRFRGLDFGNKSLSLKKPLPDQKGRDQALVKESLSIRQPTTDKEMELWVELKSLYEPDDEDQLWTHTQMLMHALVEWKLYDTCGDHHVTAKDKEIFMLVEKDYPLRKGLAIMMICYKLQVENYSRMANDLILKIHKIASRPSQQDD